jgi:hypothetical protein
MVPEIALLPFEDDAVPLLSGWLIAPHVACWYPELQEHLDWAVNP